jgi:hypothetical protein
MCRKMHVLSLLPDRRVQISSSKQSINYVYIWVLRPHMGFTSTYGFEVDNEETLVLSIKGCPNTNYKSDRTLTTKLLARRLHVMPDHTYAKLFCKELSTPFTACVAKDTCPICLEVYHPDAQGATFGLPEKVVETSCQHLFHDICLSKWLSVGPPTCPLCRERLRPAVQGSRRSLFQSYESNDPFESVQVPTWNVSRHEDITILSTTALVTSPPEDRVLMVLGQSHWSLRQRLLFLHGLNAQLENERSVHQHRRASIGTPGEQQDHIHRTFWPWRQVFES